MATIYPLVSAGSGAAVSATQSGGAINAVTIAAVGSNYIAGSRIAITIAGSSGGSGFTGYVTVGADGTLTGATPVTTNAGTAYAGTITATLTPAVGGPVLKTTAGAVTPIAGQDISAMSGTITFCIEVLSMAANKTAAIALETSVNAFGASVMAVVHQFKGQMGQGGIAPTIGVYNPTTDRRSNIINIEMPYTSANYFGISNAVARVNVLGVDASSGMLFNAWLEVA
jgi:hypothetical protein